MDCAGPRRSFPEQRSWNILLVAARFLGTSSALEAVALARRALLHCERAPLQLLPAALRSAGHRHEAGRARRCWPALWAQQALCGQVLGIETHRLLPVFSLPSTPQLARPSPTGCRLSVFPAPRGSNSPATSLAPPVTAPSGLWGYRELFQL